MTTKGRLYEAAAQHVRDAGYTPDDVRGWETADESGSLMGCTGYACSTEMRGHGMYRGPKYEVTAHKCADGAIRIVTTGVVATIPAAR